MDAEQQLKDLMRERILVIDGAMGTIIQRHQLSEEQFRGDRFPDHPTRPEGRQRPSAISPSQKSFAASTTQYLDAGADIIETNTFNANAISLSDYGARAPLAEEINRVAALAGTRGRGRSDSCRPGQAALRRGIARAHEQDRVTLTGRERPGSAQRHVGRAGRGLHEAARGLVAGGADILLIETIFDTLNGKAAIFAVEQLFDDIGYRLPRDDQRHDRRPSGRTCPARPSAPSGTACATRGRSAMGFNCSLGARAAAALHPGAGADRRRAVSAYPNAGLPNAFGGYDEQPPETAGMLGPARREGALNFVGGCCGTTPDHIARDRRAQSPACDRARPERRASTPACRVWSRSTSAPTRSS